MMSIFNGLLSGLLRASSVINDPHRVIETNVDDYVLFEPVCREDCIVLYKSRGTENGTIKLDIVFQTPINHSTKKVFSLFRTSDDLIAQTTFFQLREKLPLLIECFPELSISKSFLQDVTQSIRENPCWTAAHIAAYFGCLRNIHAETTKNNIILSQINEQSEDTLETPLHVAVKTQQHASVSTLVSLNARMDLLDNEGNTALHCAAKTNKEIITALTVRPVASIINLRNKEGCTPLHMACMADKRECVMELLRAGADVNIVCEANRTEDVVDCEMPSSSMKDVLDTRTHQFAVTQIKNGGTPLHWSTAPELIEALIEHGCNVSAKDFQGDTALHTMIRFNRLQCAVTLLSYNANVDAQGADENTPLHLAVKVGDISLIHLLVAFGADVNLLNCKGETARHIATVEKKPGSEEVLYALHMVGAKRCAKGMYGCEEGCRSTGQFNGIPPESSVIPSKDELFSDLLNVIMQSATINKQQACKCPKYGDSGKNCRLLCLDGGGIRGMVLIQLLYELEKVIGIPIVQCFDWVAGTSTGGILALVLAHGKSIEEIRCVYFQLKNKVFVGTRPYDSDALETILKRELGSSSVMADIRFPKVMLTATRADRKPAELHIFRNYMSPLQILGHEEADELRDNTPYPRPEEQLIYQAARATGAAPTYFRASGKYLDGGLIANNPTLDALTEIHQCNQAHVAMGHEENVHNISCVVSLGTGKSPVVPVNTIDVFRPDTFWGACKMALGVSALGQLLVDQATQTDGRVTCRAQSFCSMLNIPYFRLNPQLSVDIALDETDNKILAKMLWETTAYMHSMRAELEYLSLLLQP